MTTLTFPVGFNSTGNYNPLTTYNKRDLVFSGGNQYECTQDGTIGILPTNTANWQIFVKGNYSEVNAGTEAPRSNARVKTLFTNRGQLGACSLMEGGTLMKRGYGGNYNIGDGNATTVPYAKVAVPYSFINETIKQVVGSQESNYILTESGKVYFWGRNDTGQGGQGNIAVVVSPKLITYFQTNAITISEIIVSKGVDNIFGGNFENWTGVTVYFLSTTGKLYSCGQNNYGQQANGGFSQQNTPIPIEPTKTFTKIYATANVYTSLYAIDTDGVLWVAGINNNGSLGLGDTTARATLTQVTLPEPINELVSSTGKFESTGNSIGSFTIVKGISGKLYSSGFNGSGQLCSGTFTQRLSFAEITTLGTDNASIFIGNDGYYGNAGVIKNDGTVKIWGYNGVAQLGNGNTTDSSAPLTITFPEATSTVVKVVCAGTRQTTTFLFLFADGKMYTTGYNGNGQRGIANTTGNNNATQVLLDKNIVDIASYGFSAQSGFVAKTNDGTEYVWGYTSSYYISGQLLSVASISSPMIVMY